MKNLIITVLLTLALEAGVVAVGAQVVTTTKVDTAYEQGANDGADQLCTELGGEAKDGLCDIEFAS